MRNRAHLLVRSLDRAAPGRRGVLPVRRPNAAGIFVRRLQVGPQLVCSHIAGKT